jgi:hypothetical protein
MQMQLKQETRGSPKAFGAAKMKELFASLWATVFNPLVSCVLPGLTAISAWFVFFAQCPSLDALITRNHTETAFVLMLLTIFVGTVVDDLGMRIESLWLDAERERRTHGSHRYDVLGRLRHELLKEDSYALVPRKSVQSA